MGPRYPQGGSPAPPALSGLRLVNLSLLPISLLCLAALAWLIVSGHRATPDLSPPRHEPDPL